MATQTQEAVISNEALVSVLEARLGFVSPEAKNIIEDTINRIKNIGKYISEFLKRGTILTIEPAPELIINEASIRQSLEKVIEREKTRGNKLEVYIDNDIWGWKSLKDKTMPSIEKPFKATIYRFTQTVIHAKIREEADKLSVQKDWNISEAWNITMAGILAGEVDINGAGIFAYFTMKVNNEDTLCRFRVYRHDVGQLNVNIDKVHQDSLWSAGDGVVLSN